MIQNQPFYQLWIKSLFLHLLVFVLLFILSKFKFFEIVLKEPRKIQTAVRVDILDLPKNTLEELKKLDILPPPINNQEVKPSDKNGANDLIQKVENDKDVFDEVIKKSEKNIANKTIDELKVKNEKRLQDIRRDEIRKILLSGNKIKEGSRLQGEDLQEKLSAFDQYIVSATEKVKSYWKLPSYLLGENLKCRIQLFINAKGEIVLLKIMESSGNTEYDSWAERAAKDAAPFPTPDSEIRADLLRGNFVLGFPL